MKKLIKEQTGTFTIDDINDELEYVNVDGIYKYLIIHNINKQEYSMLLMLYGNIMNFNTITDSGKSKKDLIYKKQLKGTWYQFDTQKEAIEFIYNS